MSFEQALKKLPDQVREKVAIQRIGLKAVAIIRQRTLKGEFLTGTGTGQRIDTSQSQYSTKPAPIPYGKYRALTRRKPPEDSIIYRHQSGTVMVILQGGYKEFRRLAGRTSDHVNLNFTGRMMRNFGIIQTGNEHISLGFKDRQSRTIARYHNIDGAGKAKIKHQFLGFTKEEEEQLAGLAEQLIDGAIKSL